MSALLWLLLLVGIAYVVVWLAQEDERHQIEQRRQTELARVRHERRQAEATISHLTANAMQQMTDAAQAARRTNPKSKR